MATYDYSARKPDLDAFDYPTKINGLIDDLSADMTTESNRLDSVKTKTDWLTVTSTTNLDSIRSKVNGIEAGATADQTGAEIKSLYEAELDTNAFTDALLIKLNGIETAATADQTKADIDALGIDAATLDGLDSTAFALESTSSKKGYKTVVSASGSPTVTFLTIPSWVNEITIIIDNLQDGVDATDMWIKLGDGAIESTGYESICQSIAPSVITTDFASTTHWVFGNATSQWSRMKGMIRINKLTGTTWMFTGSVHDIDDTPSHISGGSKTLTGTLDRVQIGTTSGGNFTNGNISLTYEGQ